jgi:hypothetical protein
MSRAKSLYRILVLDRHKNHESIEFQDYYKSYNIITLGLSPHSFYFTQPLDVGCFSVLKRLYSQQIEILIKAYIYYIIKIEFFIAFKTIYPQSITI